MARNDAEVRIGADTRDLEQGIDRAERAVRDGASRMDTALTQFTNNMKNLAAVYLGFQAAVNIVRDAIATVSDFEQLQVQLNAVMGSVQNGEYAFAWIKQFAVDTPYSVEQITKSFMQLKNFGLDPMDGTLRKVADATAKYGNGMDSAQRVTLALGQSWARGKLQGQDIMQMIDAGIPVYDLLSNATGKTAGELQKMGEKGQITKDVMRQLIDEMGRSSAGTAEAKMNTMAGAVANMGDAYANALDEMRRAGGFEFITDSVRALSEVVPDAMKMISELGAAVGAVFGTMFDIVKSVMNGILSAINAVFGSGGEPITAMQFFINMLRVVQTALIAFRVGFETAFTVIKIVLAEVAASLVGFGNILGRVLSFDFKGAVSAYKNSLIEMRDIAKAGMADLDEIARKGAEAMSNAMLGVRGPSALENGMAGGTKPSGDSSGSPVGGSTKTKTVDKSWYDELEAMERMEDATAKLNKGINDLKDKLQDAARTGKGDLGELAEQLGMTSNILTEGQRRYLQSLLDTAVAKREQEAVTQANIEAERMMTQEAQFNSAEKLRLIESELENAASVMGQRRELGQITAEQELEYMREVEVQKFQAQQEALESYLMTLEIGTQEYEKALNDREILRNEHEIRMRQIDTQLQKEQERHFTSVYKGMESAFQRSIAGMLSGTMTFGKAVRTLFQGVVQAIANSLADMAAQWIMASIRSMLQGKIEAASKIAAYAGQAGAAGVASMAAAPFPMNMSAPAFGAAMSAAAMSYVGIASAAGGYDIPAGVNPMTQLHEKEMVLPAHIADPLRDNLAGGGGGGAMTINIHATDAQSVKRLLFKNRAALADALRAAARDFQ